MAAQSNSGVLRGKRGKHAAYAAWIFGSVLLVFLFVFCFAIPEPTPSQAAILHFLMALLTGFFAYFFVGDAVLKGNIKGQKIAASGGFALFIAMQFFVDQSALRSFVGDHFPNLARSDSRMKSVQVMLKELHLITREPNGVRDSATTRALKQFQSFHNLHADGLLTADTINSLQSAITNWDKTATPGNNAPLPTTAPATQFNNGATNEVLTNALQNDLLKVQDTVEPSEFTIKMSGTKNFKELLSATENKAGANYVLSIFSDELKSINADNFRFDIYDIDSKCSMVVPAGLTVVPRSNGAEVQSGGMQIQITVSERSDSAIKDLIALEKPPSFIGSSSQINWAINPIWSLPALRSISYPDGNSWGRIAWSGTTPTSRCFAVTIISASEKNMVKICVFNEHPENNSDLWIQMDLAAHFSGFGLQ
ncbi:MAG TPA: peptidoglycan-binding domain-containing protein [Verrucomicrobiae bacterium]|nr:peptidoglycan-binding domain-containing protein [Verrucomicrobiae bacterium]